MKARGTFVSRELLVLAIAGLTIGCDRVTKQVAASTLAGRPELSYLSDTIRFQYAENIGGFLSLGADWPNAVRVGVFAVASVVMLALMSMWAIQRRWSGWPLAGVALCVAGGASNWIDRVVRGSVIDFMNVGVGSLRTGIFNVADVAIFGGGALLLVALTRDVAPRPPADSDPPNPADVPPPISTDSATSS